MCVCVCVEGGRVGGWVCVGGCKKLLDVEVGNQIIPDVAKSLHHCDD